MDWADVVRADEQDNTQYQRYKKVSSSEGVLEMKGLDVAGTYEARFFACGTYDLMGRSPAVQFVK